MVVPDYIDEETGDFDRNDVIDILGQLFRQEESADPIDELGRRLLCLLVVLVPIVLCKGRSRRGRTGPRPTSLRLLSNTRALNIDFVLFQSLFFLVS